ncbi:MAG: DMT family transporter [Catenulispora sp.]|nr:DMT family transporter [Catenulispora sp.]
MSADQRSRNPFLLLTVTMLLWGGAFSSSKSVVGHVPHTVAAMLRFGGGAIALLVAVGAQALAGRRSGRKRRTHQHQERPAQPSRRNGITPRAITRASLAGVLGVFAYNGFIFWGLSLAPSLDGGILIPVMSPVLTTAFQLVTGREAVSRRRLLGLGLGLAGAAGYLIGADSAAAGTGADRLAGDSLYLLSAVCWVAFTLSAPKVLADIEPLTAMTCATCAGAVLLAALAAPDLGHVAWSALPPTVWLNVAYLAVGATAVANVFYYRGIGAVGPTSAALMMFLVPLVNTLCGTVFLGESFMLTQALGTAALLTGAALAGRARIRLRPKPLTRQSAERPSTAVPTAHPAQH